MSEGEAMRNYPPVTPPDVPEGTRRLRPGDPKPRTTAACGICKAKCSDAELQTIIDLYKRVAPGESMPVGQCPRCGGLCHPTGGAGRKDVPVRMRADLWVPVDRMIACHGALIACTRRAQGYLRSLLGKLADLEIQAVVERAIEIARQRGRQLSGVHLNLAFVELHGEAGQRRSVKRLLRSKRAATSRRSSPVK